MSMSAGPTPTPPAAASPSGRADIVVAGAGVVGLVLGIALAQAGLEVVVAGRVQARMPGRTVALLEGSIAFLESLGLWPALAPRAEPLRTMRIVDDTGSLFRAQPVEFRAGEIGRDWFGCNIENDALVDLLAAAARGTERLHILEQHATAIRFEPDEVAIGFEDGSGLTASLLVGADGRRSPARAAAGIGVKAWTYPQVALTAILEHSADHKGVSTEFHTRQGPFTLVPLPSPASPGSPARPHRSSLVWVMSPGEADRRSALGPAGFGREIERQSRRLLGSTGIVGATGRFPIAGMISDRMAAPRLALAGEAAHAFPPIGAQGLNLGLRDVAALVAQVSAGHRNRTDLGAPALLGRYERARRGDVALRTMGVDWLNRALLSEWLPVDALRGAGLLALGTIGPLRRFAMRQGLTPEPRDPGRARGPEPARRA